MFMNTASPQVPPSTSKWFPVCEQGNVAHIKAVPRPIGLLLLVRKGYGPVFKAGGTCSVEFRPLAPSVSIYCKTALERLTKS